MSQKNGYIKLHRSLLDCFLWDSEEKHNKRSAWIDLLLLANHAEKKILFDNEIVTVKRGQYLTSIRKLANRWGWSVNTAKSYLELLESDGMIHKKSTTKCTLIDIVNYEKYQGFSDFQDEPIDTSTDTLTDTAIDTQTDTRSDTQTAHGLTPNNNEKNDNNINIYNVHFEEVWKIYSRKDGKQKAYRMYQSRLNEGYSEAELLTATKNYMDYCQKNETEKKYIKMCSTFFGIDKPFVDYLGTQKTTPVDGPMEYQIGDYNTHPQIPPFYGFPKEWFESGQPVRERFRTIKQPRNFDIGVTDETIYSPDDLWREFELRKRGYENEQFGFDECS